MGILNGQVAIVTGAGKGLGEGEAYALAKEGAAVTVVARTLADVQKTAAAIEKEGGRALPLKCDVSKKDDIESAVKKTIEKFGRIDILVNNAHTTFWSHPLETWSDEEMRVSWETGPLGSFWFMQACFPYMKQGGGGRIVNFCSPAGHGRIDGFVGYSMTKEAIRSLTKCGAREWGKYNINVNVISPVAFSAASAKNVPTEEARNAIFDQLGSAIRRFGTPEDVGRCVVFLCGPDSRQITGCTLGVDGGSAML